MKRYNKYPTKQPALPCRQAAKSCFWLAKWLFYTASIVLVAYVAACLASFGRLDVQNLQLYGVIVVGFMLVFLVFGILSWLLGPILFYGTYAAHKTDKRRATHRGGYQFVEASYAASCCESPVSRR